MSGTETFVRELGDFEKKYGFHCSFDAYYHPFPTREERWAHIARSALMTLNAETGEPYKDMQAILERKNYHILATNQDTQFTHVFPEEKISAIQGDFRYLQCSRPCHDELYAVKEVYEKLVAATDEDLRIPTELILRCPKCGAELEPWVRSRIFLEGEKYREEYAKVNKLLEENAGRKILLWEIGVGRMTPMFTREPFWNLTYNPPGAHYVAVNPKDAMIPPEIRDKGEVMHADIARILSDLHREKQEAAV